MTDIFVYCPVCNKTDGDETPVKIMKVVNGMIIFTLACGHVVTERLR